MVPTDEGDRLLARAARTDTAVFVIDFCPSLQVCAGSGNRLPLMFRFEDYRGRLEFDAAHAENARVSFEIEANSLVLSASSRSSTC